MTFSLEEAQKLLDTGSEPRGRSQIVIAAKAGDRKIAVKIGRYLSKKKYLYYEITGLHDTDWIQEKEWKEALKRAVDSVNHQVRNNPGELCITLTGKKALRWRHLEDLEVRYNTTFDQMVETLDTLYRQVQPSIENQKEQ